MPKTLESTVANGFEESKPDVQEPADQFAAIVAKVLASNPQQQVEDTSVLPLAVSSNEVNIEDNSVESTVNSHRKTREESLDEFIRRMP